MDQEYEVPEELLIISDKAHAADKLRTRYIKRPGCYKRAVKAATLYETTKRHFWSAFRELYPQFKVLEKGRQLRFDPEKGVVIRFDEEVKED